MRQSMFDNLDVVGMLASTWDLIIGKKEPEQIISEPEQEKEEEFFLKVHPQKKFNYRPQNLKEYIGQEPAKSLIRLLIKEILEIGKYRHILISGTMGHGKTTLAFVLAKQLGFEINYFIARAFTRENLRVFLHKNQASKIPQILMLDEIHGLGKSKIDPVDFEYFYPILEDMQLPNSDIDLKPFIVMGATTELDYLQKNYPPFVGRFVNLQLEPYNANDIKLILKEYNKQVYQKDISEEDFDLLSRNARYNPRTARLLFDLFIASGSVDEVLKCNRIIKNGLTTQDIRILEHLVEVKGVVGCETLAIIGYTDTETYKTLIEPYLIQEGLITKRPRGREATNKARQLLLQEIKA